MTTQNSFTLRINDEVTKFFTLKEAEKILKSNGWTPPEEKKWQPEEGELVLWMYPDLNVGEPRSFTSLHHAAEYCRPHPTHIKWEDGELPVQSAREVVGKIYRDKNGKAYGELYYGNGWFWLPEE